MTNLNLKGLCFWKAVGAGNDFVLLDFRGQQEGLPVGGIRQELSRRLADRHFGVGSDGVVFLEDNPAQGGPTVRWDFYNSDGSPAEMCGNAARCVGLYLHQTASVQSPQEFQTQPGVVRTEVVGGGRVAATMDFLDLNLTVVPSSLRPGTKAQLVDTGVPHIVVEVSRLEDAYGLKELIREMRYSPAAGTRGANVTFLERRSEANLRTVTFERGVEGFTLACGTGVLAAAVVGLHGTQLSEAQIEAPGGEFAVRFAKPGSEVIVTGPAQIVFKGYLEEGI